MALIGGDIAYRILTLMKSPSAEGAPEEYEDASHKLTVHFGENVFERAQGMTIVDFVN